MSDSSDKEKQINEAVLNGLDNVIYVSDLETNTLLYVNKNLRHFLEGKELTGRVCWEVLHDKDKRCDTCPIPYLLKNPGESHKVKFYIKALNKTFWIQDSIVPWLDGRMAHLCSACDITEQKKRNCK